MKELLIKFVEEKIDSITSNYNWGIKEEYLPSRVILDPESNYRQNLKLKYQLHDLFKLGQSSQKYEIIAYYVKRWGHIYGNKEETLRTYTEYDCEELINNRQIKGIASWSKALCVRDPQKYAIFDARVSASLNLLLLANPQMTEREFFPRLPSQNSTISSINDCIQCSDVRYIDKCDVYRKYLDLIQNTAKYVGTDIHTVEMILFSHTENVFAALEK
jgi:hypothetical protein